MRRPPLIPLVVTAVLIAGCGGDTEPGDRDQAIDEAATAYAQAKSEGVVFRTGPCIAERLPGLDDWVADVAHDPRQDIDDDPANQCERFRGGEAHHFVELTPDGELIRAK